MKTTTPAMPGPKLVKKSVFRRLSAQYQLLMMSIPFVILIIVFQYVPLWGWIMAFQNYSPGRGIWNSPFIGWDNFLSLFGDERFFLVMRNTLVMSSMSLITGFAGAIVLALLLNEVRHTLFKRAIQTVTYIPHFVSMVVIANIVITFLSPDGFVNNMLIKLGWIEESVFIMGKGEWFWFLNTMVGLWKELGWSTIIYLAVLAGVNPELYEAADVDGAGRLNKMWHISLPSVMSTAVILLILSLGSIINIGYESQFLLGNPLVLDYSEVLDLYALNLSFGSGQYSVGIALGIFKTIISLVLVISVNGLARKMSGIRLF
ncbi:ABC transporter permease subunit [Paenibacillus sp. LHD-38]|uniref:ABC transporter permease n=1 Tax=Paenibacillus sp. LHD-38 TaxID=3072143 RepID=UPI00280D6C4F|nr:ABC transporter permease subunit [Paenibacillus sp. LHD-38]MDQ8739002.1 ABC transporter permease subunit [Paenibacillus sp. LHD-38]